MNCNLRCIFKLITTLIYVDKHFYNWVIANNEMQFSQSPENKEAYINDTTEKVKEFSYVNRTHTAIFTQTPCKKRVIIVLTRNKTTH